MFKAKLEALNHPTPENVKVETRSEYQSIVLWLEDQKIRHYKVEDRHGLRSKDNNIWMKAYEKYCKDIECPISLNDDIEKLAWLLSHAIRLEYEDKSEQYKHQNAKNISNLKSCAPNVITLNPVDNLNFYSPDFIKGVRDLETLFNIPYHPNHLITLEAVCALIAQKLTPEALKKGLPEGQPFSFEQGAGLGIKDPNVEKAARILRLLHIQDLRKLQTRINETIVKVQTITADPRTDTTLGQVGY